MSRQGKISPHTEVELQEYGGLYWLMIIHILCGGLHLHIYPNLKLDLSLTEETRKKLLLYLFYVDLLSCYV